MDEKPSESELARLDAELDRLDEVALEHFKVGRMQQSLECLEQAWAMGKPHFSAGSPKLDCKILRAGVNAGIRCIQFPQPDFSRSIDYWDEVEALGRPDFGNLSPVAQELVLQALMNAGGSCVRLPQPDLLRAIDYWDEVEALARPAFGKLSPKAREHVLMALVNAGIACCQLLQPNVARALSYYDEAVALGRPVFGKLSPGAQEGVLIALVNAGSECGELPQADLARALAYYDEAVALGRPVFGNLAPEAQVLVLGALVSAGFTCDQGLQPDVARALSYYDEAVALGRPIFGKLSPGAQEPVLRALANGGFSCGKGEQTDVARALAYYDEAVALGRPIFGALSPEAQAHVLAVLVNAGHICGQLPQPDVARELNYYDQFVAMGQRNSELPLWTQAHPSLPSAYASVLAASTNASGLRPISSRWPALLWAHFSALSGPLHARDLARGPVEPLAYKPQLLGVPGLSVLPAARPSLSSAEMVAQDWVLARICRPSLVVQPQVTTLQRQVSRQLASVADRRNFVPVRKFVSETAAGQITASLPSLGRWLSSEFVRQGGLESLQLRPESLLLTRLRSVFEGSTSAFIDALRAMHGASESAALYARIRVDDFLLEPDGSMTRAAYWWLQLPGLGRLKLEFIADIANSPQPELGLALAAWRDGDFAPARAMLETAWTNIAGGAGERDWPPPRGRVDDPFAGWTDTQRLTWLLQELGAGSDAGNLEVAREQALGALIYGDVQQVVQTAVTAWLKRRVGDSADPVPALEAVLFELLNGHADDEGQEVPDPALPRLMLRAPPGHAAVLRRLHELLQEYTAVEHRPEQHWERLETQRFALTSASLLQPEPLPESHKICQQWRQSMLDALKLEQAALKARVGRILAGEPDKPMDPQADVPFGPFVAFAKGADKAGWDLRLPQVDECRKLLQSGERLVQLWFDAEGAAHLLQLEQATGLRDRRLNAALSQPQWDTLLQPWQQARQAALQGQPDRPHILLGWQGFVAADSPASALIRELKLQEGAQVRLMLPGALAQLPWLARAVSGTAAEGDFGAGQLLLEPGVAAWMQARQQELQEGLEEAPGKAPGQRGTSTPRAWLQPQVLYTPHALRGVAFGQFEAQAVAAAAQGQARPATGLIALAQALASPAPLHLVMHGQYDAFDPQGSCLSLRGAHGQRRNITLPGWLLRGLQVRAEVSLSACESMLTGTAESASARLAGPSGLGPLLRMRGARAVLGPLGHLHPIASWYFHHQWHTLRYRMPAAQALAQTQRLMREVGIKQLQELIGPEIERLRGLDRLQANRLHQAVLSMAEYHHQHPLAHPALWTQFSLLGQAAAWPEPPQKPSGAEPGPWWMQFLTWMRGERWRTGDKASVASETPADAN